LSSQYSKDISRPGTAGAAVTPSRVSTATNRPPSAPGKITSHHDTRTHSNQTAGEAAHDSAAETNINPARQGVALSK
ncbi:unnamed protein product, partial [Amoebophrya sp. A120]